MYKPSIFFGMLATVVLPTVVADTNARLQDGTPIIIDDTSRGVYVLEGNVRRPLWGGVHRLENGSSVTVTGGILINEFRSSEMRTSPNDPIGTVSQCQALVAQVCGADNHCAPNSGCLAARQLLQMEEKERIPSDAPATMTPSSDYCVEASKDILYFVPCAK